MRRLSRILMLLSGSIIAPMDATAQDKEWVESTLKSMTLEEKVGQLFIADLVAVYSNKKSPVYQYALRMIKNYHVGGFVLAGGTVADIAVMTNALQRESKVPLVINADLESGLSFSVSWRHARGRGPELPDFIFGGGTGFPSQMAVAATSNPDYAYRMGKITGREARAVGIHWTNSPVVDVNNNPQNPIINTRSFGEDPKEVSVFGAAYIKGLQEENVIGTLKHFPGHGDTEEDTHMGLPMLSFDLKRLESTELVPFKAGIEAGARAVMTAHLALPKIDPEKRPATLSPPIMSGLLRTKLGFQGIIVTDGMTMQGVTDKFSPAEAAVLAIEAGADAILVPENFERAYEGILQSVKSARIAVARIDESVRRLLSAKSWLGLHKTRFVEVEKISDIVGDPESMTLAQEISDRSVTLLRNNSSGLPVKPQSKVHIAIITDEFSTQAGVELIAAFKRAGQLATFSRLCNESPREQIAQDLARTLESEVIVAAVYLSIGSWKGKMGISNPLEDFVGQIAHSSKPTILVAFGDPYILGKLPSTDVVLACYNGTILAERSVAKALLGLSSITGKLPVTIPGKYNKGQGLELSVSTRKKEG